LEGKTFLPPLLFTLRRGFVVCVKPLSYPFPPSRARRLLEWLETLRALGANKVVVYHLQLLPELERMLR